MHSGLSICSASWLERQDGPKVCSEVQSKIHDTAARVATITDPSRKTALRVGQTAIVFDTVPKNVGTAVILSSICGAFGCTESGSAGWPATGCLNHLDTSINPQFGLV